MARLILWNVISLDGFFEGAKSWEVDWFQTSFGPELHDFSLEQLRSAGMMLFGRVTYEGMAAYWQTATGDVAHYMNTLPKAVFSHTLERADWANTQLFHDDPVATVRELKRTTDKDIFIFGSAHLSATLFQNGLFDEVRLALMPIVIGSGATLFGRGLPRTTLKLLEARPLSSDCVILRYQPFS